MLRSHEVMISQGDSWAVIKIRDKTEDVGKSASGTWNPTTDTTNNDSEITFTSASKDHLSWTWSSDPGTLVIGEKWDQSLSSHKASDGPFTVDLITLEKVRRASDGKLSPGGSGKLKYGVSPLFKAGNIEWSINRYEH